MIDALTILFVFANTSVAAEPSSKRPISVIVSEANDTPGRARSKALDELSAREPESAEDLAAIVDAIKTKDKGVQAASFKALRRVRKISRHLTPQVGKMLDDSSEQVQLGGIIAAGQLQDSTLAPKLRSRFKQRPHFKIKKKDFGGIKPNDLQYAEEAATALVALDDFESVDELLSRDEIMAFSNFGGPLVARFGAKALPKAVLLARQKGTLRSDGGRSVISSMRDPAAIPALVELGKDSDNAIASAAILALSNIPTPSEQDRQIVESALLEKSNSKERYIRGPALDGLLKLNPEKHLPAALEAVKSDDSARLDVLHALVKHKVVASVPALESFIKEDEQREPNWTVNRKVAAQTIFKLTGRRVPYLGVEKDRRVYPDPYDPTKR